MTNEEKTEIMETVEVAEEEKSEKKALPWWKNRRAQYGLIAGACALVIAGGAGIAIASNQPVPAEEAEVSQTSQVEQATEHDLKVTLDLPEWSDTSTPALLEVNDGIDTIYKAVDSANPATDLTLENGTYTLTLVSPINADGSIYIVSDPQTLNVDGTTGANIETPFTGTKLPAEDVTEDQINAIKDAFNKAKDTGKVDQTTVDKVTNNANAGTDARNSKTDEEKQQAQDAAKQETASKQEQAQASVPETSRPSSGNSSASTPASNNTGKSDGGSSSNSGSNTDSGNKDSGSSTPAHEHSWSPVYKTVHHDAVTEQQPVYTTVVRSICNVCGADITGNTSAHGKEHAMKHEGSGHHVVEEKQITGYKTVITKQAYDEQVVDYYRCSCGSTK